MKTLFIDTHSEKITIILKIDNDIFIDEKESSKNHSENVVPLLEKVLKEHNTKAEELGLIIVVNGPGSFTGVRIGVTIAKTIAYSFSIPIKTITSLEMYGVSTIMDFNLVTETDSKGVYSAKYFNGMFSDFTYQKRSVFDEMVGNYKVLNEKTININKIIEYLDQAESVNPHLVNPLYIKEIDVLK